jgi:hypothetical protein
MVLVPFRVWWSSTFALKVVQLAADFVVAGAKIIVCPYARAGDRVEQPIAPACIIALGLDYHAQQLCALA